MGIQRVLLGAGLLTVAAWGRSTGAPARVSGVPGEGVCTDCHTGTANSGPGNVKITLLDAEGWLPGQQYRLRVTLTDPDARRWGFQITPRLASDTTKPAGSLALAEPGRTQIQSTGGVESITHVQSATGAGASGSFSWEILWKAPADVGAGDVKFYVAGNAANNNNNNQGDRIYTASVTLSPIASTPSTRKYLPAFVFGDGWSTAMYGYNLTAHILPLKIAIMADNGTPMAGVPTNVIETNFDSRGGGSLDTKPLAAGPSSKGYVAFDLPAGTTAYGVLRAPLGEQGVVETAFPLVSAIAACTLPWDETERETLISLVNAGSEEIRLTLTLRNEGGGIMAVSPLRLAASARSEFKLFERPEFASIPRDQSGTLDISASSGSFAIAAFRVGPGTIAAIPVSERQPQ